MTSTMHAVRAHERGGPERFVYESAPRPEPAAGEALVAVCAASITVGELDWGATWTDRLDGTGHDRTPTVPSHEFSGIVAALGSEATDLGVGDEVYGLIPFTCDGAGRRVRHRSRGHARQAEHPGPRQGRDRPACRAHRLAGARRPCRAAAQAARADPRWRRRRRHPQPAPSRSSPPRSARRIGPARPADAPSTWPRCRASRFWTWTWHRAGSRRPTAVRRAAHPRSPGRGDHRDYCPETMGGRGGSGPGPRHRSSGLWRRLATCRWRPSHPHWSWPAGSRSGAALALRGGPGSDFRWSTSMP